MEDFKFETIHSKEDFMRFLSKLQEDSKINSQNWENITIDSYLESVLSWVSEFDFPPDSKISWQQPSWALISLLFYSGKIYE